MQQLRHNKLVSVRECEKNNTSKLRGCEKNKNQEEIILYLNFWSWNMTEKQEMDGCSTIEKKFLA